MNTEKYYYGLDIETTKFDSSIIDCKLPGPTPVNPSINNTTTIISPIKNYKKLVDCPKEFTLTKHNDAITDSSLQVIEQKLLNDKVTYSYSISTSTTIILGTPKDVYLGYEDINKIFDGNLSSVMTAYSATLDSDVTGCSAKLSRADTTGALIKYSLNKCTKDRIITFSYKNTPIFKIKQTYEKKEIFQIFYIWQTPSLGVNGFALFEDNNMLMTSFDKNQTNKINKYMGNVEFSLASVLFYFCDTPYMLNFITVGDLINSGRLTHLQGHDYLNTQYDKYKNLTLHKVQRVNTYNNYDFSTTQATLDMKILIFIPTNNGGFYRSPNYISFGETDNSNHIGVYKYIMSN